MDLSALVLFSNGTTLYEHGTTCRTSVSHSSNYFSKKQKRGAKLVIFCGIVKATYWFLKCINGY
jgi:hypothetical protein